MVLNTNKLRAAGATALLALTLAACGASSAATTPASSQPAATAASAPSTAPATAGAITEQPTSQAAGPTAPAAASAAKLNLNELTEQQVLSAIPNFPNRMVREFMEYRPYISILQFRKEIGKYVSADEVAMYEQYVYVPVDIDQADAATLQQLPGVDASIAAQLIAGRPYGSNQAFLTKLASLAGNANAQQATAYLAAK